jgi:hypothetical protein
VAAPKTKETPQAQAKTVAELVDELGAVEQQLAPYRVAILLEERLRSQIRTLLETFPAGAPVEVRGERFTALVGCKAIVSTVDNKKAYKAIGQAAFLRAAKLTLAALEREGADLTGLVSRDQTGARSLRVFPRTAPAPVDLDTAA